MLNKYYKEVEEKNSVENSSDSELTVQAVKDEIFEGLRMSMIINNANASREYLFDFNLAEGYKIVTSEEYFDDKELDTGELFITNADNEITRIIESPWAIDANGKPIDTEYTIMEDKVSQTVHFDENTAFPVVADPGVLDYAKCTGAILLAMAGAGATVKALKTIVKASGGVKKAAKYIYKAIKLRKKGKSSAYIKKAFKSLVNGATIGSTIMDVTGITLIFKACGDTVSRK